MADAEQNERARVGQGRGRPSHLHMTWYCYERHAKTSVRHYLLPGNTGKPNHLSTNKYGCCTSEFAKKGLLFKTSICSLSQDGEIPTAAATPGSSVWGRADQTVPSDAKAGHASTSLVSSVAQQTCVVTHWSSERSPESSASSWFPLEKAFGRVRRRARRSATPTSPPALRLSTLTRGAEGLRWS